jgi:hypothetical protein
MGRCAWSRDVLRRPTWSFQGPPDGIIGLLAGKHDRPAVAKVTVKGDARKIAKLRPHAV